MKLMSFVLVEKGGRYLLIQETSQKQYGKWYLPGGKADEGEDPQKAAMRETMEEARCEVRLNGIFYLKLVRKTEGEEKLRVYYDGTTSDSKLKTQADEHSLNADWFTYSEILQLSLREDALEIIDVWIKCKNLFLPVDNFVFKMEKGQKAP